MSSNSAGINLLSLSIKTTMIITHYMISTVLVYQPTSAFNLNLFYTTKYYIFQPILTFNFNVFIITNYYMLFTTTLPPHHFIRQIFNNMQN